MPKWQLKWSEIVQKWDLLENVLGNPSLLPKIQPRKIQLIFYKQVASEKLTLSAAGSGY